jgi:hypothetical protein
MKRLQRGLRRHFRSPQTLGHRRPAIARMLFAPLRSVLAKHVVPILCGV